MHMSICSQKEVPSQLISEELQALLPSSHLEDKDCIA